MSTVLVKDTDIVIDTGLVTDSGTGIVKGTDSDTGTGRVIMATTVSSTVISKQ